MLSSLNHGIHLSVQFAHLNGVLKWVTVKFDEIRRRMRFHQRMLRFAQLLLLCNSKRSYIAFRCFVRLIDDALLEVLGLVCALLSTLCEVLQCNIESSRW